MTQILVVEDETIIALNLKENLESLGYAVVGIAASGEKAVKKATQLRPDLVLMDIRLKGDMDGIQAAQQIWENLSIPVIFVTGHSDQSTLERATITAPFGYVLKPVKERELPAPLNLKQFCRQLVQEYQLIASDRQVIQLFSHGKGYTACIDEKLLQQILGNLFSNALKYSSIGSQISLVLTCKNNQVIFQVHDEGIGIPQEDQPHIFEPFHWAENVGTIRGTGMGLAIVKKAVDLHGGTISFKSKVAIGTTFTVTLPRGRT